MSFISGTITNNTLRSLFDTDMIRSRIIKVSFINNVIDANSLTDKQLCLININIPIETFLISGGLIANHQIKCLIDFKPSNLITFVPGLTSESVLILNTV